MIPKYNEISKNRVDMSFSEQIGDIINKKIRLNILNNFMYFFIIELTFYQFMKTKVEK
jgi:hypothetical protein